MSVTSSPPPPLTFQTFLEKMRQPSAASLVRRVKSFIASIVDDDDDETADFDNQYAVVKRGRLVQKFLAETEASFTAHPAWRGSSADELEASGEGLEKYVMTKAHARVFGKGPRDAIRDEGLKRRIAALREIIKPEHLDVTESSHAAASWALAESELGKINQFKAPRDKLVCALNTCRIINNTLTTRQGSDGGADDFLPALVYVTLKANPDKLESNLKYIQRFRGESRLVSEAAYFFTNLVSAARFLGRAEAKDFTGLDEETFNATMSAAGALEAIDLDDDEFVEESEEREEEEDAQPRTPISVDEMSAALSALEEKTPPLGRTPLIQMEDDGDAAMPPPPATPESVAQRAPPPPPTHTPVSIAGATPSSPPESASTASAAAAAPYIPWRTTEDVEAEGATALTALDVSGNLALSDYKFLYARAEDLTVGDVSKLLHDYKGLALQYESLSRGTAKVLASLHRAPRR